MDAFFLSKYIHIISSSFFSEEIYHETIKDSFEMLNRSYGVLALHIFAFDQKMLEANIAKTPRRKGNSISNLVFEKKVVNSENYFSMSSISSVASKSTYASKPFNYNHPTNSSVSRYFPILVTADTANISFCDNIPKGQIARLGVFVVTVIPETPDIDTFLKSIWEKDSPYKALVLNFLLKRLNTSSISTPESKLSSSGSGDKNNIDVKVGVDEETLSRILTEISRVLYTHSETYNYAIPKMLTNFSRLIRQPMRSEINWTKSSLIDNNTLLELIPNKIIFDMSSTHYFIFTLREELCTILDATLSIFLQNDRLKVSVLWANTNVKTTRKRKNIRKPIQTSTLSSIPRIDLSQVKGYRKRKSMPKGSPRTHIQKVMRHRNYADYFDVMFEGDYVASQSDSPFIFEYCMSYIKKGIERIHGSVSINPNSISLRIPSSPNELSKLWWWENVVRNSSSYIKKSSNIVVTVWVDDASKEQLAHNIFSVVCAWGCQSRLIYVNSATNIYPPSSSNKKYVNISIGHHHRDIQVNDIDDIANIFDFLYK